MITEWSTHFTLKVILEQRLDEHLKGLPDAHIGLMWDYKELLPGLFLFCPVEKKRVQVVSPPKAKKNVFSIPDTLDQGRPGTVLFLRSGKPKSQN